MTQDECWQKRYDEDSGGPFMGDCGTILSEGMQTNVFERHRIRLCPQEGKYGVLIPPGIWHSVTVHETSTLVEGGMPLLAPLLKERM